MKRVFGVLAAVVLGAGVASAQEVVEYVHLDALGSVRAVSNQANVVIERHDYLPFGEECTTGACTGNPGVGGGQPRKFTGKERDQETGLDYFGARYYGAKMGRFTTIDPVYTWADNLVDPQRWNRYSYSLNNPLRYLDPDGRQAAAVMELGRTAQQSGVPWVVAAGGVLIFVAANSDKIPMLEEGDLVRGSKYNLINHLSKNAKSDEEIRYDKFVEDINRTKAQKEKAKEELKKSPNAADPEAAEESMSKTQEAERKGGRQKIDRTGKAEQRAKQNRPKSSNEAQEE